jgi:hypothetical protein
VEEKKKELQRQDRALEDKEKALDQKEKMLKDLAKKTAEALSNAEKAAPPPLQNWQGMLEFVEEQLNQIFDKRRAIKKKKKAVQDVHSLLDLKLVRNRRKRTKAEKKVLVDLEVANAGDLALSTSYLIKDVTWGVQYDLRIREIDKKANLTCAAAVSQETGEDWKDVHLTFSTARPLLIKRIPTLTPKIMGQYNPYAEQSGVYSGVGNNDIRGLVSLDDGSNIPGVSVSLEGSPVGRKLAVTGENGSFAFFKLPSGTYQLKYELEGFRTIIQKDIRLFGDKIARPHVAMALQGIREEVTVSGKVPVIDRRTTSGGSTFSLSSTSSGGGGGRRSSKAGGIIKPVQFENKPLPPKQIAIQRSTASFTAPKHGVSLSFALKHKETVASNQEAQKATIFIQDVKLDMEHVAVPRRSEHTFLKAVVKNISTTPFLAGKINIFLNGTFVNTASIDFINPKDTFEVPVGLDESVKVTRETLKETSKEKGLFKKKKKKHMGYLIHAKNFGKSPIKLTIIDQIPVSSDKKIQVTTTRIEPTPKKQKKEKDDGILQWQLNLQPGEKKTLRVEYDIFYPQGMKIEEQL